MQNTFTLGLDATVSLSDDTLHLRAMILSAEMMIPLTLESERGMIIGSGTKAHLTQHDRPYDAPERRHKLNGPPMTIAWFAQDREVAVWML